MPNINNSDFTVIRQCLQLLPTEHLSCPVLNYDYKKLTTEGLLKAFTAAQLGKWESYREFGIEMHANEDLMQEIGVEHISVSQLSRRINELDTSITFGLFLRIVQLFESYLPGQSKVNGKIGSLALHDSTNLSLSSLSSWAKVSKEYHVVKMHTSYRVLEDGVEYPEFIIPSTGKVSDHEGGDLLIVEDENVTNIMDRGYMDLFRMNEWILAGIRFVIRLRKGLVEKTVEESDVSNQPGIVRDAKVILGETGKMEPVRVVEYRDDEGNSYNVATNRWDLTATEIADLYKKRWLIELFFKWMKQSLRMVKLWSTSPKGIWNQMFIAATAYILTLIVKLFFKSNLTLKQILRYIRAYFDKSWGKMKAAILKKPGKTSKGRQKIPKKPPKRVDFGSVALVHEEGKKRVKRKIK